MKIGWGEILFIVVIALVVLGPDQFPVYAKKFGKMMRSMKGVTEEFSREIRESVIEPVNEMKKPLEEAIEPVKDLTEEIKKPLDEVAKEMKEM